MRDLNILYNLENLDHITHLPTVLNLRIAAKEAHITVSLRLLSI
jgi:hypothetical protein